MLGRGGLTLGHRTGTSHLRCGSVRVRVSGAPTARFPTHKEVVDHGAGEVELGGQHTGGGTLVWKEQNTDLGKQFRNN